MEDTGMTSAVSEYYEKIPSVAEFQVSRVDSLADEPVKILLKGVLPFRKITLRSTTAISNGYRFSAHGHHRSDGAGTVDLSSDASTGGTYATVDPMALFWSVVPEDKQRKGIRFIPNIFEPSSFKISAYAHHIDSFDAAQPLAEVTVRRHWISDAVACRPVKHGRIRGLLFSPKNLQRRLPAILDIYGSGGGLMPHRAALLAAKGFVTLSLAFFRYADLPRSIHMIDLDYFVEAVDYLRRLDCVAPGGVGAIGLSKGADVMLEAAALTPHITALAFVNGMAFPMLSLLHWKDGYRRPLRIDFSKAREDEDGVVTLRDCHWVEGAGPSQALPIERVAGKVLIFASADDQNVPAVAGARLLAEKMERCGRSGDCSVVELDGAGHILEPAYMPHCGAMYMRHLGGYVSAMGGESHKHHQAQLRYWELLVDFFKANLRHDPAAAQHRL